MYRVLFDVHLTVERLWLLKNSSANDEELSEQSAQNLQ